MLPEEKELINANTEGPSTYTLKTRDKWTPLLTPSKQHSIDTQRNFARKHYVSPLSQHHAGARSSAATVMWYKLAVTEATIWISNQGKVLMEIHHNALDRSDTANTEATDALALISQVDQEPSTELTNSRRLPSSNRPQEMNHPLKIIPPNMGGWKTIERFSKEQVRCHRY